MATSKSKKTGRAAPAAQTPKTIRPNRTKRQRALFAAVCGIATLLLVYGSLQLSRQYSATHRTALPSPRSVITKSTDHPGEAAINTGSTKYEVAANMPKLLSIPSLHAEGFIQQVGVDTAAGAMAVPTNVHLAGWYTRSVKPGDDGLSIIDGHVQGYYAPGIFKNLNKLKAQDSFYVQNGDGTRRNFQVVSSTSYPVDGVMAHLLSHDPAIKQQLNLITCGGTYDKSVHSYSQRLVVVAKRIEP